MEEGHLRSDHVHVLLSIPPKQAVSQVVGYIKGKCAIHIVRSYLGRRSNFTGQRFWQEAIGFLRSEKMKRPSENTSEIRRKRTADSSNSTSSDRSHL